MYLYHAFYFILKRIFKKIYLWLRCVFIVVHGLSLVVLHGFLINSGFSCCRTWALGCLSSAVMAHGLEYRLNSCGALA